MKKSPILTITDADMYEKKSCTESNKQTGKQTGHEQWTRSTNTVIMQTVAAHVLTNKEQQQYIMMVAKRGLQNKLWLRKVKNTKYGKKKKMYVL